jgi:hypothetical protein
MNKYKDIYNNKKMTWRSKNKHEKRINNKQMDYQVTTDEYLCGHGQLDV